MYNISKGHNSKSPCMYYKQLAHILDCKWWKRAPTRDKVDLNFKVVLEIQSCNVLICTLHAFCRIIEKLVFLDIGFAWKLCPKVRRKEAIQSLEAVLSEIGLHGGDVHKKSTNGKDIPIKTSISGEA